MKLLIQWAVTSSALILIVLAARFLCKDKLSARLKYALWGVVLLRLLVPFQVELPAAAGDALPVLASNLAPETARWEEPSIPVLPERSKPVAEFNLDIETTLEPGDILSYSDGVGCLRRDGETITWYRYILSPEQIVLALWLVGAGLAGAVMLVSNLRFYGRLRKRREGLERAEAPIPVYVTEGLSSPCLFGVLRPAVYVTAEAAERPDTLRHILAHELTHYAHFDNVWSLLRCLALALHWYNPLVWLAVWLSKEDGELACDEGAVARLGEGERIPYGRTLVDMVAARSLRPGDLLSCSTAMTGGKKSIQQRVALLVKKPETVKTALFAAVSVVVLAVVFVFAGRGDGGKPGDYQRFKLDVNRAQSIHLSQESTSSYDDPTAITDPELLELAKEVLEKGAADWLTPPSVLEDLNLSSLRTLTLTGQDGQELRYLLVSPNTKYPDFYVITEGSISNVSGSRIAASLKRETVYQLYELMRRQGEQSGFDSPALTAFLQDVESASSIRFDYPPSYSGQTCPDPITDPRLLALAREKLCRFVPPEENNTPPDPKKLTSSSMIVLSDGTKETVYTLVPWNDWTWLIPGDALSQYLCLEEGEELEYGPIVRSQVRSDMIPDIAALAQMQQQLAQDPTIPVPMTRTELSGHTPEGIWEARGYRLQGWSGDLKEAEFYTGCTSLIRMQLWYYGDETHDGSWVLELLAPGVSSHSSGYTVVSDQPSAVFVADQYRDSWADLSSYEVTTPDTFAACLLPEDVVSVTTGGSAPGQTVEPDILALKDQLTRALYHQFSSEYEQEKHGQYVLTIQVKRSGIDSYLGHEIAQDADRLTLSVGSEEGVVCLSHRNFAITSEPTRLFVRSLELYHTILALHGLPSGNIPLGIATLHVPSGEGASS